MRALQSQLWISPEVIEQIVRIGQSRSPREACGIIVPSLPPQVVEIDNTSDSPEDSFQIKANLKELMTGLGFYELTPADLVVWHTHPSGLIGPSAGDMGQKNLLADFRYLVVTLPEGQATEY